MSFTMQNRLHPLLVLLLVLVPAFAAAQLPFVETAISMRDGRTLQADIYHNGGVTAKPVILVQTPYNKALYRIRLALSQNRTFPLDTMRYHYVFVDWRGFYASSAAAVPGYDRGLDGYDLVEWIAAQDWSNGKVGTYGGSALGIIQFQTARHHPPHLICAVPMIIDYRSEYSDYYYGGVLRREHVETLENLGFVTVDIITSRPVENAVWDFIKQENDYPGDIAVPLLMVSGWFDHYPSDILRAFADLRKRSDAGVRDMHKLIMGPWLHDGVDREQQGELVYPGSESVARDAALQFFDYHLHGAKNGWPLQPVLRYYQMGENRWEQTTHWDDAASAQQTWYLHADGSLSPQAAAADEAERHFTYDPTDPSPSHGGARFNPFDPSVDPGPRDIRALVEERDDVLLYTSSPLARDIRVRGAMSVDLHVRSDRRDTDFSVRLCDVYPDGRSVILTDGILRARFREGTDREVLLQEQTVAALRISLQDIAHTFLEGHRIRLVIGSADYPRFDINLNNGGEMYVAGDTLTARNSILHAAGNPSRLTLRTVHPLRARTLPPAAGTAGIQSVHPQPFMPGAAGPLRIDCERSGGNAEILVVDMLGRVRCRLPVPDGSGPATLTWDGRGRGGSTLPAGVYQLSYRDEHRRRSRSILLLPAR
ncbi:MAG: CocE/NonD family hydrolase [Bacteroidota bacterium]|nr:CocE/NonD family hydrolase [Bacteroidota bacterium]